jgi:hypothetical protein
MKCPKCQYENPRDHKFCGECGAKLETVCPKCNSPNPRQFKFCGECGHNLTVPSEPTRRELTFDEKLKKIQKYLPKGITEKILAQRDRIEGEKRQVTVMFCDMEGYTSISEKLGPEGVYTRMMEALKRLVLRGSEIRPLIMAFEDLHWMDKAAEEREMRYEAALTHLEMGKRLSDHDHLKQAEAIFAEIGAEFDLGETRRLLQWLAARNAT